MPELTFRSVERFIVSDGNVLYGTRVLQHIDFVSIHFETSTKYRFFFFSFTTHFTFCCDMREIFFKRYVLRKMLIDSLNACFSCRSLCTTLIINTMYYKKLDVDV